MIGQMVGRYRVVRPLGEGGMARVFVAEDTNVGRQVAIKVLLPEFSRLPGVVERFMNEAKAMGRIRHPGVVDVFEVMVAPSGELCIIMELVVGETLREALWKHGPLPPTAALAVMEQLADTVAAALAERTQHAVAPDHLPDHGRYRSDGCARSASARSASRARSISSTACDSALDTTCTASV